MVNKFEAIGIGVSIMAMVFALYLMRIESAVFTDAEVTDSAQQASVIVADNDNQRVSISDAVVEASSPGGNLERLIIDDILIGSGDTAKEGDVVSVHYIGTLQNGQQFDNSYLKGTPFSFTVGTGKVIKGWDLGIVGMQAGGQRILVIPSDLAYGDGGFGPIPGGATLVFAIELLSIE